MSKTLKVPYYSQSDFRNSQSACLKMFAHYLSQRASKYSEKDPLSIYNINQKINRAEERPDKNNKDSFRNMLWWLQNKFFPMKFEKFWPKSEIDAEIYIKYRIDKGYPVIASSSYSNFKGSHVILIVGYQFDEKTGETKYICHDPYGLYNPILESEKYSNTNYEYAEYLPHGGDIGPGKEVTYDKNGIRRIMSENESNGWHFFISAKV